MYFQSNGIEIKYSSNEAQFTLTRELGDDDILKKQLATIPNVVSAAKVSTEGLPIVSALPAGIDEERILKFNSKSLP